MVLREASGCLLHLQSRSTPLYWHSKTSTLLITVLGCGQVYIIPYLVVNNWLVTITLLQHTHPKLPHYNGKEWDWLRGALATVDRSYGFLDFFFHHIADTHVAHHLFSAMPHYHAEEVGLRSGTCSGLGGCTVAQLSHRAAIGQAHWPTWPGHRFIWTERIEAKALAAAQRFE